MTELSRLDYLATLIHEALTEMIVRKKNGQVDCVPNYRKYKSQDCFAYLYEMKDELIVSTPLQKIEFMQNKENIYLHIIDNSDVSKKAESTLFGTIHDMITPAYILSVQNIISNGFSPEHCNIS